jgi:hypothetical protein
MRFLIFNIMVVLALVYIFTGDAGKRSVETAQASLQDQKNHSDADTDNTMPVSPIEEPTKKVMHEVVSNQTELVSPSALTQKNSSVTATPSAQEKTHPQSFPIVPKLRMPPIDEAINVRKVKVVKPVYEKESGYMKPKQRSNELARLVNDMELFATRMIVR